MLDLLGIASLSFIAALSGAIVPGPVFALVVSESLRAGKIAGPLIVLGHFIIEWIIIFMIFLGLGPVLDSKDTRIIVGFVGGSVLALMGLRLAKAAVNLKIDENVISESSLNSVRKSLYGLIASGFLSSCSNPHVFLWWLATGAPLITSSLSIAGLPGLIYFLLGHAAADLSWFSFVSYSVCKGRRILSRRAIQIILFVSAAFLVAFAFHLILSAWLQYYAG
ncbi:MAG: LysE family transporter [Candidatus Bathyarchaeia archaeon]|nr:LysE family transporter [Candidatus Bathyarchaeota archaeon]